ncbi:MAG TPA: hypothetical protein VF723_12910 [Pyrinomonadaceae bacterium]|jgi:cytochrome c556
MANRRRIIPTVIAAALIALCLPALAAAQGNYDPWGRDRRDNRDYGRDRDYRRSGGRYGYDNRAVRDAARRVDDRSGDFQRHLDSALDRSRYDDTRREDRINERAREFRSAADNFRDRLGDARDLYRASNEARRLLQLASQLDRVVGRTRLDSRTASDWSQITQDLRLIADAYGLSFNGTGGYYGRDDDYRRNDRRNNNDWWRRLPFPQ